MARIIADMPAGAEVRLAAPGEAATGGSLMRGLSKAFGWLGVALLVTVALFPVLWALLNSLKELMDIVSPTPRFLFRPTLDNYRQVLHTPEVLSGLYNSILVVGAAVGLGALLGVPAAYAIARYPFRRRDDVQFFVLSLRFLPPVAVAIPLMAVWIDLGVYDTRFSLIVTYLLTTLSTIIWLSIPAFQRVPREVEEAATIDGYGPYAVFWRIALPIASKTLLGGVVFSFVLVWNELMMALTLTSQQAATLPVIAATFTSMGQEVPWGVVNASTVLLALPPLVFLGLLSQLLNSMLKHR
jgi:multiple sugar transport system permease protein